MCTALTVITITKSSHMVSKGGFLVALFLFDGEVDAFSVFVLPSFANLRAGTGR